MLSLNTDSRNYVAGHRGPVGAAISRALKAKGCANLIHQAYAHGAKRLIVFGFSCVYPCK